MCYTVMRSVVSWRAELDLGACLQMLMQEDKAWAQLSECLRCAQMRTGACLHEGQCRAAAKLGPAAGSMSRRWQLCDSPWHSCTSTGCTLNQEGCSPGAQLLQVCVRCGSLLHQGHCSLKPGLPDQLSFTLAC